MDDVTANRAQQADIYGAPLGDILGHCAAVLGLRQQGLAGLLGLSAPMLSQLMTGHRIKIANPTAAERLRLLVDLVGQVDAGELTPEAVVERMQGTVVASPLTATSTRGDRDPLSDEVQAIFRATASAGDYLAAAQLLEASHPDIAELLRVYGTERADRARDHTQRLRRG